MLKLIYLSNQCNCTVVWTFLQIEHTIVPWQNVNSIFIKHRDEATRWHVSIGGECFDLFPLFSLFQVLFSSCSFSLLVCLSGVSVRYDRASVCTVCVLWVVHFDLKCKTPLLGTSLWNWLVDLYEASLCEFSIYSCMGLYLAYNNFLYPVKLCETDITVTWVHHQKLLVICVRLSSYLWIWDVLS